jgi:hypothetical protein
MHEQIKQKYNKAIPDISKEHICEEDKRFLKKESW